MMKQLLFFFISLFFFITNTGAQISACGTLLIVDDCANAPTPSICEVDGISGNTGDFGTGPADAFLTNFCGPGTGTSNSLWIGFTAATTEVSFFFDIGNCVNGTGIQAAIIETDCSTYANTLSCVGGVPFGATQPFILTATSLTIGDPYYIMIDGYANDFCDFEIQVDEIYLPDVNYSVSFSGETICGAGEETTLTAFPNPSGAYLYQWYDSSGLSILGETNASIVVDQSGQYTVRVYETVDCCFGEFSTNVVVETNPPQATTTQTEYIIDCNNPTVTLEGAFTPNNPNFSYTWLASNGVNLCPSGDCTSVTVSDLGTYTFFVYDPFTGCTDQMLVDVIYDCCPNFIDIITPTTPTISSGLYTAHIAINSNATVTSGSNVSLQAGTLICLSAGFEVELGTVFEAIISDCQ